MTVIKTTALALMALLMSATAAAGHHEKEEGPKLAAKPGQGLLWILILVVTVGRDHDVRTRRTREHHIGRAGVEVVAHAIEG